MRYKFKSSDSGLWGDYGNILIHGIAHRATDGVIEIKRTGPWIPPMSLKISLSLRPEVFILVSQSVKEAIEEAGLTGPIFKPTRYSKVVNLDWRSWSFNAKEPEFYPPESEPENYIYEGKHCSKTASQMNSMWELDCSSFGIVNYPESDDDDDDAGPEWSSTMEPNIDIIKPNETWSLKTISEHAKSILQPICEGFIEFEPCDTLKFKSL